MGNNTSYLFEAPGGTGAWRGSAASWLGIQKGEFFLVALKRNVAPFQDSEQDFGARDRYRGITRHSVSSIPLDFPEGHAGYTMHVFLLRLQLLGKGCREIPVAQEMACRSMECGG
jgi:hypothetical protein